MAIKQQRQKAVNRYFYEQNIIKQIQLCKTILITVIKLQITILKTMNFGNVEIETIDQYITSSSDRNKRSQILKEKGNNNTFDVLCKISFDIDNHQEQIFITENTSLERITSELIQRIKLMSKSNQQEDIQITTEEKIFLKEEIKTKILNIMDSNSEKSLQTAKWRNKLKNIIEENQTSPLKTEALTRRIKNNDKKIRPINYFGYNGSQNQSQITSSVTKEQEKKRQIYDRLKKFQQEFKKDTKRQPSAEKRHRLYDLRKQNDTLKQYISKIHEHQLLEEELSQCTFHPKVKGGKYCYQQTAQNTKQFHYNRNVFNRLYNEAFEKKEKMKQIEKQILSRQKQSIKQFDFIPHINQCSREIIKWKRQLEFKNIYEHLYSQTQTEEQKNIIQQINQNQHTNINKMIHTPTQRVKNTINQNNSKYPDSVNKIFKENKVKKQKIHTHSTKTLSTMMNNSFQKSPIAQKSKKMHQKFTDSSRNIIDINKEEQTLKKKNNRRTQTFSSELHLKDTIQAKKGFNRLLLGNQKNRKEERENKTFFKKRGNTVGYVNLINSKNIQRQRILITQEQPTTEPNHSKSYVQQKIEVSIKQNSTNKKDSSRLISPSQFFKLQEQKKNSSTNKENVQIHHKPEKDKSKVELLFQQRKAKIFESIFQALMQNSNIEGEISYQSIANNDLIPSNLEHIFYPMAEQMHQLSVGLDRQEFTWSIQRIFDSLSVQQRGLILSWGLKLQEPNENIKSFR